MTLPPVTLPVVLILPVPTTVPAAKYTLPLNAAPVMLPSALTCPPVVILPPLTLPVAVTNPPVIKLPPVTLPPADTNPLVVILPLLILPTADILPENGPLLIDKSPPMMLPDTLKLVPVAAPIFGVVRFALALTMIFPVASNAVVMLSTLADINVAAIAIPLPAV